MGDGDDTINTEYMIWSRAKCVCGQSAYSQIGQEPLCDVVELSNSKNDSQNFLTPCSHSCDYGTTLVVLHDDVITRLPQQYIVP